MLGRLDVLARLGVVQGLTSGWRMDRSRVTLHGVKGARHVVGAALRHRPCRCSRIAQAWHVARCCTSTFPSAHHADGGYGALSSFMDVDRLAFPLRGTSVYGVNRVDRLPRLSAFRARLARVVRRYGLVHILYPDAIVGLPRLPVPTVLMLHTPMQLVSESRHLAMLIKQAASVIVLYPDQVPLVQARSNEHVDFIPQGIDVRRYRTPVMKTPRPTFVVVGSNLRDCAMLNEILMVVRARHPEWTVHLVGVDPARIRTDLIGPGSSCMIASRPTGSSG